MKKSKRYRKKLDKTPLINKRVMRHIIENSNICKHAISELKLAGYTPNGNGPTNWMYHQVLEAVAVFASHGNSGHSAPWEIDFVKRLCNFDVLTPLRFTDDEWNVISKDGTCQNKRKSSFFKDTNGSIHNIYAFSKKPTKTYRYDTKTWEYNNTGITWNGGLFEFKDGALTGRYFNRCNLWYYDIEKGYSPKETQVIDCVEIEIAKDDWIMAVDADNHQLVLLSCYYNIQWKECPCMKDVRLEDVTPELSNKAYEEIKHVDY